MKNLADDTFADLLASLASKTPAPGGGAAAGLLGATGAALAGMVVAYSIGKKAHEGDRAALEDATIQRLGAMRDAFLALADEDAQAYASLNALQKKPADDPVRIEQEPGALRRAIDAPESARRLAMDLLTLVESLEGRTNKWLASDLAIAAVAAEAAAVAAGWNVRINAPGLPGAEGAAFLDRVRAGDAEAGAIRARVEAACRGG
jgi:formiminotetrahydrofolate cyclodeaminase